MRGLRYLWYAMCVNFGWRLMDAVCTVLTEWIDDWMDFLF